jgi:hypothetical protein
MMLGKVIRLVEYAFLPVDVELALAHAVADPVEAHINSF